MKSDEQKSNSVLSGRDARSDERQKPDVLELPDDLRIPLHELQADAGYLIGLVANKPAIMRSPVLQSLETKLSQVAEAAYRLNGERSDMLNALKSLVEIDDDEVKITGAAVRERLARARNLIAKEKEPCDHPSGDAQNAAAPIAAPTPQPTALSAGIARPGTGTNRADTPQGRLADAFEAILVRRWHEKKLDGYTLETSQELALAAISKAEA